MPFYVIDSIFTQPFDTFGNSVAAHRAYLQQGYDSGLLLCSGPKADRQGGILIANASDPDEITRFLAYEPYQQQGLAHYRLTPFDAVKQHPCLAGFTHQP